MLVIYISEKAGKFKIYCYKVWHFIIILVSI